MPGTVVDTGKLDICALIQTEALAGPYTFGLFTTNVPILHDTVTGDLTEAVWAGYARAITTSWSVPALTGDFHAQTVADPCSFSNASGSTQTYWGWFLANAAGDLIAAYNYGVAQSVVYGGSVDLTPALSDQTEF
jgi:hypothetical protein